MTAPADSLDDVLSRAKSRPLSLSREERARLLSLGPGEGAQALFDAARSLKTRLCGREVAMRALLEVGNVCAKDCLYCGIRRSNARAVRYRLGADDIVRLAEDAAEQGYTSLVLQSGELEDDSQTRLVEEVLRRVARLDLGVTLSMGEQSEDVYRRWREAGATRYLLRIETSSPALYGRLHPRGHSWERRVECLRALRRCDYQVGTGVMCGLPGQTAADLADDIGFFADMDVDMIGMGPFIPHPDTPLAGEPMDPGERLLLGLKMIAVARLHLHDVNIAAATALQALAPDGRERGVLAGANVVMPNATDAEHRRLYRLYAGKPCLDEPSSACLGCLSRRLEAVGEKPLFARRGDSLHYVRRKAAAEARE
ncbi:MAG: [FeFe] hydrogenase H-cluster radical SAM maturase HydE [Kiritimatiellae bacterium]|nr:[FeFe] hydrogenase H-cluster radical SAM maturase HydE [Kiritimatiellia bacterium]